MKHVVITAGSKGLGRMITEQFLQNGCSVTVNYRSDVEKVRMLKQEWREYSEQLQFVQGDVTKKADISKIVSAALEKFGRIDCLINNAGPYIFEKKQLVDYSDEEWYEILEGNLSAPYHFAKLVIPVMRKQKFGRIIMCSYQGAEDTPGWRFRAAFAAAKSGLVSLTRSIALEEAVNGITANVIGPGDIVGEMKESLIKDARLTKDDTIPIGRPGTGEDVARAVYFLCHEDSDFITGSVIPVAGGIDVVNRSQT